MSQHSATHMLARAAGKSLNGTPVASLLLPQSYEIVGGRLGPATPSALNLEPVFYNDVDYRGRMRPSLLQRDVDPWAWRENTDVVIQGIIRSERPVTSLDVQVSIHGSTARNTVALRATGNRTVERGPFGLTLSEPIPFDAIPMRYDFAYGGTDEAAEERDRDPLQWKSDIEVFGEHQELEVSPWSYPRNPAGKGYLVDELGVDGLLWPNLEFIDDAITTSSLIRPLDRWGERPTPACFDWLPHSFFPRSAYVMGVPPTHDDQLPQFERDSRILPQGFERLSILERPFAGFAQGAHPLLCRQRLYGDERIRISAMSPSCGDTMFQLTGHRPTMYLKPPQQQEERAEVSLDLVFVETERQKVTLVWRGSVPLRLATLAPVWEREGAWRVEGLPDGSIRNS